MNFDSITNATELGASLKQSSSLRNLRRSNSHVHLPPNFSAFKNVEEALSIAQKEGLSVLGASNYYDFQVYKDFLELAKERRIFPQFGLEIIAFDRELSLGGVKLNDPGNPGKLYLCGKGITGFATPTTAASETLSRVRSLDSNRTRQQIILLNDYFTKHGLNLDLSEQDVVAMIVKRHGSPVSSICLQERHVCQAFQEKLFEVVPLDNRLEKISEALETEKNFEPQDATGLQNEIRNRLLKNGKPAYVEENFISIEESKSLILELRGIPCYPVLADGAKPLSPFEETPEVLVENITKLNLHMAEFVPVRNAKAVLENFVPKIRQAGVVVSAGTEHNSLSMIPLEPACLNCEEIPQSVKEIFWEGSCVIAAHQFLNLNGQCGYVDGSGKLNPSFSSTQERIDYFKRLGEEVIAGFCG